MPTSRPNKRRNSCKVAATPVPIAAWRRPVPQALALSLLYAGIGVAAVGPGLWRSPMLLVAAALAGLLIAASVVDMAQQRLPDWINAAILLLGLATASLGGVAAVGWTAAAAVAGFAALWLVGAAYERVRGMRGIGLGDAKLLGAGLSHVGLGALASVVLIAAASALIVIAVAWLAGVRFARHDRLAFGPFLALGIWIVWLVGPLS